MPLSNDPTTSDVSDRRNGKAKRREKTRPQIAVTPYRVFQPELITSYPSTTWFTKVRTMRTDPTLSLVRDLVLGPILASEWSVGHTDDAPEGATEFVRKNVENLRSYLVENTLTGLMDFGWQGFEKIWTINDKGETVIEKVKPLLQDITQILVDTETGEFVGTKQTVMGADNLETIRIKGYPVVGSGFLKAKDVILCNTNVEGTYWYGRAWMANAVIPYDGWDVVNAAADMYDKKIAGSHWVIYYPLGSSYVGGEDKDNFLIAQDIIVNLERSGAIAVPRYIDETITELNKESPNGWQVEMISDQSNQQSNFIDRLAYYDALKVRALGFPERSVLQGQFGTKAESEVHSDLAVVIADYRHSKMTEQIGYQLVDDLMRYNYGSESIGSVFIKAAPISDDLKIFLRQVFLTLMQHAPEVALEKINADEVKERLGLPRNNEKGDSSEFDFPEPVEPTLPVGNLNPMQGDNTSDPLKIKQGTPPGSPGGKEPTSGSGERSSTE